LKINEYFLKALVHKRKNLRGCDVDIQLSTFYEKTFLVSCSCG